MIIKKMLHRFADSNSGNPFQQSFKKSFLVGALGYFVFLFTLATSYWFLSVEARFGLTKIDSSDLIISWMGFFTTSITYFLSKINRKNFGI